MDRARDWLVAGAISISIASAFAAAASADLGFAVAGAVVVLAWIAVSVRSIMMGLGVLLVARSSMDVTTSYKLPLPSTLAYLNPAGVVAVLFSVLACFYLWHRLRGVRFPAPARIYTYFLILTLLVIPLARMPITSAQEWTRQFAPFCAFLILMLYFRSLPEALVRKSLSNGVVIIILASAVPLAVAMYQIVTNTGEHLNAGFNRVDGTFPMPNGLAAFIALIVPILACAMELWTDWKRRTFLGGWIAFALVVLVATYTRTAWISLAVSALVLFFMSRRIRLGSLILVALLGAVGYVAVGSAIAARFSDLSGGAFYRSSLAGRLNIWNAAAPLLFRNPVSGQGLGMFAIDMGLFEAGDVAGQASAPVIAAHNDYLRVLVETGAIGFMLYFGTFVLFIRRGWKMWKESDALEPRVISKAFVAVCLGQLVAYAAENMFGQPSLQFYFWSLAGVATGITLRGKSLNFGSSETPVQAEPRALAGA
jgi:O-antigen ligase